MPRDLSYPSDLFQSTILAKLSIENDLVPDPEIWEKILGELIDHEGQVLGIIVSHIRKR